MRLERFLCYEINFGPQQIGQVTFETDEREESHRLINIREYIDIAIFLVLCLSGQV